MPDIEMRFHRDMLVVEGGIGFMLARYGVGDIDCPELLNVTEPDLIEEIHKYYHLAGADCAISNTYGASRGRLEQLRLADCIEEMNVNGVRLAARNRPQHVFADMGPSIHSAADPESRELAVRDYSEQVELLASQNPDAIYVEGFGSLADALCAVEAAKTTCGLPVICTCVFDGNGDTLADGQPVEAVAGALQKAGADVVGASCNLHPKEMTMLAERLAKASNVPTIVSPDVAEPEQNRRGDLVYNGSTDDMARAAAMMMQAGVQMIGSCCGSTPAYTSAIYAMVGGMTCIGPSA